MQPDRQTLFARRSVAAIFFLSGALVGGLVPYFPLIKQNLHLSAQDLGLSLLFSPAGAILAMPSMGRFIAKFGSRALVVITGIVVCAAVPLAIVAPSVWFFRMALLLFGASNGSMDVSMNSQAVLIQHRYPKPIMSFTHGCWSLGGFASAGAISLAAKFGQSPFVHALVANAIILVTLFVCSAKLLPHQVDEDKTEPLFSIPKGPLLVLGLVTACAFAAEGAGFDWVAVFFRVSLKTSEAAAAIGFASFTGAMSIGRLLGDLVVHRLGNNRTLQVGSLVSAIGMLIGVSSGSPVLSACGFALSGLGLSNLVPILFRAAGSVPGVSTGTGIAAVSTCGYASFFLAPPLIGFLADHISLAFALAIVGSLSVLVGWAGGGIVRKVTA